MFYFETFNSDTSIRKVISGLDDTVMANQFIAGRFDAMIVLDPEAIEKAMKDINFTDYSYANYRYVPKSATTMACRRKAFGLGSIKDSIQPCWTY